MVRYQKYNYLTNSFQLSKSNTFKSNTFISVTNLQVQAGHFKLNSFHGEQGLLLTSLTNQFPKLDVFTHGKKLKNTVLLTSNINKNKWLILDKLVNELLPATNNLKLIKNKNNKKLTDYKLRIRSFFELNDLEGFITERIIRNDIFLPIYIKIQLNKNNENILRMFRIPIITKN